MTDESSFFDIEEWYLKRDGLEYGPVDFDYLSGLLLSGAAPEETLVRRESNGSWVSLGSVCPKAAAPLPSEATLPPTADKDPAVETFRPRLFALSVGNVVGLSAGVVVGLLLGRPADWWELGLMLALAVSVSQIEALRSGIEISRRAVYLLSGGRRRVAIPLDDIDRQRSVSSQTLFGGRALWSKQGRRFVLSRFELGQEQYERLMGMLQLPLD